MFLIAALVYVSYLGIQMGYSYFRTKRDMDRIRHIVASEELILDLNKELRKLTRSAKNLQLPDDAAVEVFQDQVQVADVQESASSEGKDLGWVARLRPWSYSRMMVLSRRWPSVVVRQR